MPLFSISKLMRPLWSLLFIILTPVVSNAAPGESSCVVEPISNPLVEGRASSIRFPDGRMISVVGHVHGERQIYDIVEKIDSGELSSMSDVEFNQMLNDIRDDNREPYQSLVTEGNRRKLVEFMQTEYGVDATPIIRPDEGLRLSNLTAENHAEQDRQFIEQVLDPQSPIPVEFIGFEGSRQTWRNNFPGFVRARHELIRQYQLRVGRGAIEFNQSEVEEILLAASNANVYTYMEDPLLANRVPVIGTESRVVGEAYRQQSPLDRMSDLKQKVLDVDEDYWEARSEDERERFQANQENMMFIALFMHVYSEVEHMNISSFEEFERYASELSNRAYPWIQSEVNELIEAMRTRVRINFARDEASARNLVAQHRSGVHFVGLNHYRNTLSNLVRLCQAEQGDVGNYYGTPESSHYSNPEPAQYQNRTLPQDM